MAHRHKEEIFHRLEHFVQVLPRVTQARTLLGTRMFPQKSPHNDEDRLWMHNHLIHHNAASVVKDPNRVPSHNILHRRQPHPSRCRLDDGRRRYLRELDRLLHPLLHLHKR
jgi:hypothetical protein